MASPVRNVLKRRPPISARLTCLPAGRPAARSQWGTSRRAQQRIRRKDPFSELHSANQRKPYPFADWLSEALKTGVASNWLPRNAKGSLLAALLVGELSSKALIGKRRSDALLDSDAIFLACVCSLRYVRSTLPPKSSDPTNISLFRDDYSPHTQTSRVRIPVGSLPNFLARESCRTVPPPGPRVSSEISRFPPQPFIPATLHTHFTLIGPEDHDLKSRPKSPLTHS
ncbi:hypothetical protein PR048_029363 [Dryococelus australis]|uniref:Uncharacterized protein n=1 Tax=Dryococelus australis TaxID=614101 RepID=A0ABQ9GFQ9_9NEOP|nr:hypothetical protein PR048_029363 [Dryococelus australis]